MSPVSGPVPRGARHPAETFSNADEARYRVRGSFRPAGHGERHCLGLSREDLMVGAHQFDPYLVRARWHPGQVDRIDIARVRPQPRQVVHMYVGLADTAAVR